MLVRKQSTLSPRTYGNQPLWRAFRKAVLPLPFSHSSRKNSRSGKFRKAYVTALARYSSIEPCARALTGGIIASTAACIACGSTVSRMQTVTKCWRASHGSTRWPVIRSYTPSGAPK